MQLQPIHETAIDLLVAGKRQHEVADELKISARTLRRWSDEAAFVQELSKQHEFARKLNQDEAQQLRRQHRELQRAALQEIQRHLTDPATPLELRKHCLTLSLRATHFDIAQEWREFMYFDRKKDKAAENADRITIRNAKHRLDASAALLDNLQKASPTAFAAMFGGEEAVAPPASSRQVPETSASRAAQPNADKSGHAVVPPASSRQVPARTPSPASAKQPKADKAKHEPHPELDAICAEVVRESFGRSPLTPNLGKNQALVHRLCGSGARRARRNREILQQQQRNLHAA